MMPPETIMTESPDRFEPSPQQKAKQGKSASKRIALFVFIGAGLVFTLVAMSILSSDSTIGGSNAPVNLFEASKGAESVPLPRPRPPEPEPEPILAEPVAPPPPPRARPVYIPVPKVSERRKREQARRLVAAGAPSSIQAFSDVQIPLRAQGREGAAQTARQTEEASALAEAARLLGDIPVPQSGQSAQGGDNPFMPPGTGTGGGNDPNGWARKEAFIKQNLPEEYSQHIRTSPRTPLELKSGALLPCVLISGLNSDLPGNMVAQVSENVYDSATGRFLLIPRGSKVIGTYDNQISYGQSRVLVIWSRLVFPDGSTLVLDNLGGADQSGYSGFKGKVNRHWGPIISAALMVSLLGAGVELAAPTNRNGDRDEDDPRSILAENAAAAVAQAITQIIQREANRQPTIKVKPGYRFMIFVQRDILFPRLWR